MPLPGGITTITITGTFKDAEGRPQGGTVTFWPTAELTDTTDKVIIGEAPITAVISPLTGQFSQVLPCTDNTGLQASGQQPGTAWQWNIAVDAGATILQFTALIPSTLGSSADISVLLPPPPPPLG